MAKKYDFVGWATKNDLLCSDGRIIRRDAFKDQDGQQVPLVWNHCHNDPDNVLGHAMLKNEPEGVRAYATFNDTEKARSAKIAVMHGDIVGLSIYANQLKQSASDVLHGVIREVSLVLATANPGAQIEAVLAHGEGMTDEEAIIISGEGVELYHSEEPPAAKEEEKKMEDDKVLTHADEDESDDPLEVFEGLSDKQKNAVFTIFGEILEENGVGIDDDNDDNDDNDEEDSEVKHNVFEGDTSNDVYLSHADEMDIVSMAKEGGSFQNALKNFADQNGLELQHDAIASSGFVQDPQTSGNVTWLFPEYKDVRPGAPEIVNYDQGWVDVVMSKTHKSPISRIRTSQVDIRDIDSLRAKGYKKGERKTITGNFQLVRRTTDPQTVYVKSALHRDDIIDITDFDYVQYLYNIDRMNLNQELAMAIMLGDFREDSAEDKIDPNHIRPIWTDDELYTIHTDLDVAGMRSTLQGTDTGTYFGDNFVYASALIEQALYARETFKGSGTPDFFLTPHMLNVMLLARDRNGYLMYRSKAELASALNVGGIYTAEQFNNRVRKDGSNAYHKLLGIMVNLSDYHVGATKGGQITHFTQFDIDFNQQKSLLETRCSGALTRIKSAIVIEEPTTVTGGEG